MLIKVRDVEQHLKQFRICFWDFDGVIKESVDAKIKGFRKLFEHCDKSIVDEIVKHHIKNGGISRFEKIPLYFQKFLKIKLTASEIQHYSMQFSDYVKNEVLISDWVGGIRNYLKSHQLDQKYFIVTGTPEEEMKWIAHRLGITTLFQGIYGSPTTKEIILNKIISENKYIKGQCIMIGDSLTDYDAAKAVNINFLLRKTIQNESFFSEHDCVYVNNFK